MTMNGTIKNVLELKTIKDFDFAVGGPDDNFIRVSEVTEHVTDSEVNLLIWILLEKEFDSKKLSPDFADDAEIGVDIDADGDHHDGATFSRRTETDSRSHSGRHRNDSSKSQTEFGQIRSRLRQSKKYAEDLLQAVGITIPFQLLSTEERNRVFNLFSSSSNLLLEERYSSILDLYEALRRRSKFRETFQMIEVLGQGNFGEVFSVQSPGTNSQFAMKRIPITFDAIADLRMILNESMILKRLTGHPNIVQYCDSWLAMEFEDGDDEDALVFYLQMELCGSSLARWKLDNPSQRLGEDLIVRISRQLADALQWIHSKGFLHLDINPRNILWANPVRDAVKIVDFGLAIVGSSFSGRTGTPPYCAPESTLTAKSDIFSLGVTLFEISQNFNTTSELYQRLSSKKLDTGVAVLDDVLPKMLSKHSQRPSAFELKTRLQLN